MKPENLTIQPPPNTPNGRAVLLANDNNETQAIEQWRQASKSDPTFTQNWTTHLRKSINAKQRARRRSEIISDLQANPPP